MHLLHLTKASIIYHLIVCFSFLVPQSFQFPNPNENRYNKYNIFEREETYIGFRILEVYVIWQIEKIFISVSESYMKGEKNINREP